MKYIAENSLLAISLTTYVKRIEIGVQDDNYMCITGTYVMVR